MTEHDSSSPKVDDAADTAPSTRTGDAEGPPSSGVDSSPAAPDRSSDATLPPGEPRDGRADAAGNQPATEGNRQLLQTVRSIERLEESN